MRQAGCGLVNPGRAAPSRRVMQNILERRGRPDRVARHHHPVRQAGWTRGHGRRRPGLHGSDHRQGQRPQGPPDRHRRHGAGGLRRRHRRCVHPARTAGEQAGALSRPARTRLRRAGEGLAHRPLPAPAGGDDGGGRQGSQLHPDRHRRRAGAGGRRDRHRLGRQLRAGRGARADGGATACPPRRSPGAR